MSSTARKRNVTLLEEEGEVEQQNNNTTKIDNSNIKPSSSISPNRNQQQHEDDPRLRAAAAAQKRKDENDDENEFDNDDDDDEDSADDENENGNTSLTDHHHHHQSPQKKNKVALSSTSNAIINTRKSSAAEALALATQMTPFESLVTQYEAASNHLPANLGGRFQDAVFPGSQQLALLLEQWISAEGLTSGGHGHKNNNNNRNSSSSSQKRSSDEIPSSSPNENNNNRVTLMNSFLSLSSSSVGLTNASKARLRNLLEQGLTDFVQRLQLNVLSEVEVVNIASAQVVARGGILSHQFEAAQQELAAARKEIARTHQAAQEQNTRMLELEANSKLRDEQFDLVRQQLSTREEMLREATTSFRKELNRFRSRISELEAEADRRRHSPTPVVGGWGGRGQQQQQQQQQQDIASSNNNTFVGTLRPHHSIGSANANNNASSPSPHYGRYTSSSDPDPRGILAAATAMDQLGTTNQQQQNHHHMDNFSFTTPDLNNNNNNNTTMMNSVARTSNNNVDLSDVFSASSLSIPRIIQVASDVGMQEAVLEMKREFDKKLKVVKERYMHDKRESLAQLRSKQELTILQLQRDAQEREKELTMLREFYHNNNNLQQQHNEQGFVDDNNNINNRNNNNNSRGNRNNNQSASPIHQQPKNLQLTEAVVVSEDKNNAGGESPAGKSGKATKKKGAATKKAATTKK